MPPTLPDDAKRNIQAVLDEAQEILSRNPNVHSFDEAYDIAKAKDICGTCDPDNDVDCGWESREIGGNTYFIAYTSSGTKSTNTVGIQALSMDEALTKWESQYSDLYVYPTSIFKYAPYSAISKVYTVATDKSYKVVY